MLYQCPLKLRDFRTGLRDSSRFRSMSIYRIFRNATNRSHSRGPSSNPVEHYGFEPIHHTSDEHTLDHVESGIT
jgi:hypothetical protein